MTFPAYRDITKDIELGYARWRVYMFLVHEPILNHTQAIEVKVIAVAHALHMSNRKAIDALDWLVKRGYLIQHARDGRRTRSLSIAWERRASPTQQPPRAA